MRFPAVGDPLKLSGISAALDARGTLPSGAVFFFDFGPRLAVGRSKVHDALASLQWPHLFSAATKSHFQVWLTPSPQTSAAAVGGSKYL